MMKISPSLLRRTAKLLREVNTKRNRNYIEHAILLIAEKVGGEFHCGASRWCITFPDEPTVIKIPDIWENQLNYCDIEVRNYQAAKDYGIAKVLLPCEFYCRLPNRLELYLQPKYDCSMYDARKSEKYCDYLVKAQKRGKEFDKLYDDIEAKVSAYDWFTYLFVRYGKRFCQNFAEWLQDYHVNDLHASNVDFLHNKPIILDYAGYFGSGTYVTSSSTW